MWVNPAHIARCVGKKRYRTGNFASKVAKKATEKSGEFIIAYECPDCGFWHIGHPDPCQFIVAPKVLCKGCREPIPEGREGKFCRDQCKLDYIARQARKAMLNGYVPEPPKPKPSPKAPETMVTPRKVIPVIGPRPVYSATVDLSALPSYAYSAITKRQRKEKKQQELSTQQNNHSTSHIPQDLIGYRFGGFTVVDRITGKWVVECMCGAIEHRKSKAVRNPLNIADACCDCLQPVMKMRSDIFKETGIEVSTWEIFQHVYKEYLDKYEEVTCINSGKGAGIVDAP